jgi:ADP-heptose:LPS heptosyltransferase
MTKKVLIISISGVGDVVSSLIVATPLLKEYKNVDFLILDKFKGLFKNTQFGEYLRNSMPKKHYDLVIDMTSNKKSRVITRQINASKKIGRSANLISKIKMFTTYNKLVKKYPGTNHIIYDFKPVLDHLKLEMDNSNYFEIIGLEKESTNEILIHIGADKKIRCIPIKLIIELCLHFKKLNIPVRLIGTEVEIANDVMQGTDNYPYYEQGDLSLVKQWIINSKMVIAPDSGIFHLSSALNAPTIGVFGPNTPQCSGSINNNVTYVELDYSCRPCDQTATCPYNNKCMNNIDIGLVLNAEKTLFAK